MASINKVILVGNVGRDPEVRTTQSGTKIASLSVATSERWKGKDGSPQEKTEWHRVSVFNERLVDLIERYVKKGSRLYVEGALQTRKWTDKDGQDRYTTEVVLNYNAQIQLLDDRKSSDAPASTGGSKYSKPRTPALPLDDDIPF